MVTGLPGNILARAEVAAAGRATLGGGWEAASPGGTLAEVVAAMQGLRAGTTLRLEAAPAERVDRVEVKAGPQ
jgi:hypothetical protein